MKHNPKISVIVPIYGVERFIERCVTSLMNQTLSDVEYIFVDDASQDHSVSILQKVLMRYPDKKKSTKLIVHEENAGLPAVRNSGMIHATGDYVFHCDSDDFLERNALELLYNAAVKHDADVVWSDWFLTFETNERYMHEPSFETPLEALKAMLGGGMKYNVWNKLIKRNLYTEHHILFPTGYGMGEDMTIMLIFAYAKNVCHISEALYHYVKINPQSITRTLSQKNSDSLKFNVKRVSDTLINIYGTQLRKEIAFLKLEAKFPLLTMSSDFSLYKEWHNWYPEANRYIWANKNVSIRSRLVQLCARYKIYWVVWLHYQIVCRFFYGFIYK